MPNGSFNPAMLTISPVVARVFGATGWDGLAELPDPDVDVPDAAFAALDAEQVRRYVARLPDVEQVVVTLRFGLAGRALTCRELAQAWSCSPGHVHAVEHRALERLRTLYRHDGLL
jgi:DNA-directed RNA polymerase specialized sigma24 family protein